MTLRVGDKVHIEYTVKNPTDINGWVKARREGADANVYLRSDLPILKVIPGPVELRPGQGIRSKSGTLATVQHTYKDWVFWVVDKSGIAYSTKQKDLLEHWKPE